MNDFSGPGVRVGERGTKKREECREVRERLVIQWMKSFLR